MDPWIVVIVAGVAALVGGMIWIGKVEEKRRTIAMAEEAAKMGFAFEPETSLDVLKTFGDLPLYDHGHQSRVRNVMTGKACERDVKFFDYAYIIGSGKDAHAYVQSVALFLGTHLPDFQLQPETFLDRIASKFGAQDIDFDASPEFSKAYRLSGSDEMQIRSAFSAEALRFFDENRHWWVEVRGGNAAIYRSQRLCKPEEAPAWLDERLSVLRALVRD